MAAVYTASGDAVLVDETDVSLVSSYKWSSLKAGRTRYAIYARTGQKSILMHRLIMNPEPNQVVDHIDGDGLNNRRSNLRICSFAQNCANKKRRGDKFKGVYSNTGGRTWQAKIGVGGRLKHLGTFQTKEDAALAYDFAAMFFFGEFANLNFNDTRVA